VDWTAAPKDEPFIAKVTALAEAPLREAYQIRQKALVQTAQRITKEVMAKLQEEGDVDAVAVNDILFEIEAKIVRSQIWMVSHVLMPWYTHCSSNWNS